MDKEEYIGTRIINNKEYKITRKYGVYTISSGNTFCCTCDNYHEVIDELNDIENYGEGYGFECDRK